MDFPLWKDAFSELYRPWGARLFKNSFTERTAASSKYTWISYWEKAKVHSVATNDLVYREAFKGTMCLDMWMWKDIHNSSCYTGQHSPGYHESRWNCLLSHAAPCFYQTVMISRWSWSVLYMIIYLGRPLLWTICRSHSELCGSPKQLESYRWLRKRVESGEWTKTPFVFLSVGPGT